MPEWCNPLERVRMWTSLAELQMLVLLMNETLVLGFHTETLSVFAQTLFSSSVYERIVGAPLKHQGSWVKLKIVCLAVG